VLTLKIALQLHPVAKTTSHGTLLCELCYQGLKNPGTEADSAGGNATTTATIAAPSTAVAIAPCTAPAAAAPSSGVVAVPSTSVAKAPAPSKTRSSQKRKSQNVGLTAAEKLDILTQLDDKVSTIGGIVQKYGIHCNSIANWRKDRDKIQSQVKNEGRANKRQAVCDDGLMRVRVGIRSFYELNESLPKKLRIPITCECHSLLIIVVNSECYKFKLTFHSQDEFFQLRH
jgi:hypothetical protein